MPPRTWALVPSRSAPGRVESATKDAEAARRRSDFRCAAIRAIGYAEFFSRSHPAVIRVYDEAGNVIETHEHTGDFREW
jgi:hypothetical protein